MEQLEPGNSAYNICRAARITGALNIAAIESSLNEIVRRHEALRTSFMTIGGSPAQVIGSAANVKLESVFPAEAAAVPRRHSGENLSSDGTSELQRFITEFAQRLFKLDGVPMLRAAVISLNEGEHILLLATHHIVADAWSMGILTRELWTLYDAYVNKKPASLPDLPLQYIDYSVWQREWLQGEVLESQLTYWKKQLGGTLPVLNLPTDRPRPARQTFHGAKVELSLSSELTKAVNELSRREGVTLFMTLLAAFNVLLSRYTGEEDILVGSPIANRSRREIQELIGFFVNTLLFRTDLSGTPSFKQLLSRVRDVCFGAYAHQDLPFEKLVNELQPERDLSRNPLFQVMFVLQNTPRHVPAGFQLKIERMDIETVVSKFDLTLGLAERDGKLSGFIEYNTDLFDRASIERMAGHFQTLLEGIVADPNQPISTLPILTEAERHQLLVEWNDTTADYPRESCIHELFEAQVERTPDAVAVEFEGKQLTYRELNHRANQLAHYLRSLGVGPEDFVGISVEPSLEMVVGLLGILKAGGAYVPLDPRYPKERLTFMIEDSGISVLLTQKWMTSGLRLNTGQRDPQAAINDLTPKIIYLDTDWPIIAGCADQNPISAVTADSAAYVIYTSGSMGTPKGVIGLHRGAINRFAWMWKQYPFGQNERNCIKTSLSFVDSVWEIFGPLLEGVPTIIIPNRVLKDPELFVDTLATGHVTRIVLVPSLLKAILDAVPNLETKLPDLKLWTSSGEVLARDLAERFQKNAPKATLLNLYGSSEVAADVTFYDCRGKSLGSDVPIGRPISNTQIYILDSNLQPVPIGVPGELYIGADGVAREYLNRPELTSERFIPNPLPEAPTARLFRTGDRGRYLRDGNIEFLGRVDNQVKVRGYRIELREIEAALNNHAAVKDTAIVPRSSPEGNDLIGYVVPQVRSSSPSETELRKFLRERLPEYMIPSAFVLLETLPRTRNGKLDPQKLPLPANIQHIHQGFVPPRSEIEQLIAQTWSKVLRIRTISTHDNFFELGGHSLLAVKIVSRLRDIFSHEVPLRLIFEAPTVAALARKIEGLIDEGRRPELPAIIPVPRDRPLPLSLNQEHIWYLDQLLPGTNFFNISYVYQLRGEVNVHALERSVEEILVKHEALRTVFTQINGRVSQIIESASEFKLPIVDLCGLDMNVVTQQAARLILEDKEKPFDLTMGQPVRITLLRLTSTEYLMLITMHHIISDQWSVRLFRRDLAVFYNAFVEGRPPPVSEHKIHFADYAVWERELVEGCLLGSQLDYWSKQLQGPLPQLGFRKDVERQAELDFTMQRRLIEIDERLFVRIKLLAQKENCTPFMVLITALYIILSLYTGEKDIRLGTLVANRSRHETENVVGHFVNTVVLRITVATDTSAMHLLRQVRDVTLAAHAHLDIPFEHLVRVLENEKRINRKSLFQVLCNYQNVPAESTQIRGIEIQPWDHSTLGLQPEVMITTLDLILNFRESETRLAGILNYNTSTFGETGIPDDIANDLCETLETAFQPDVPVAHTAVARRLHLSRTNRR